MYLAWTERISVMTVLCRCGISFVFEIGAPCTVAGCFKYLHTPPITVRKVKTLKTIFTYLLENCNGTKKLI